MYALIVFDVDGTLYDLEDVVRDQYDLRAGFFAARKGLTRAETEKIFAGQGILPYKSENARSATEFFLRSGIDPQDWSAYCSAHFSPAHIDRGKAVSGEVLRGFAELAPLALLSSNSNRCIDATLEWLGIDRALFADRVCADDYDGPGPFGKRSAIRGILQRHGVPAGTALSIGDRYESDIQPLLELGGDGVLLRRPVALVNVLLALREDAMAAWDGKGFTYYCGKDERGKQR